MASEPLSLLPALAGADLAAGDLFYAVDVSASPAAARSKQLTVADLGAGLVLLGAVAGRAGNVLVVDAVNGSDSTGARGRLDKPFLTPAAAKAAAQSGDCVFVRPGAYTCSASLAKDGVRWWCAPGASVTFTGDTTEGIWDDGGAAMTFQVGGLGTFARTGVGLSTVGTAVNCSHASSVIDITCLDLSATGSSSRVVNCAAGVLRVNCRDITAGSGSAQGTGVWWGNGRLSVTGRRLSAGNGVYSQVTATPTGDGHVRFDEIVARVYGVYDLSTDPTAAVWVRADIVKSTLAGQAVVNHQGAARVYVEAQKLFGTVQLLGSGLFYLRADKVTSVGGGQLYLDAGWTGTAFAWVQHWDATGVVGNSSPIQAYTGTHNFNGGDYTAPATAGGLTVGSGVIRLRGLRVDTSANSAVRPVTVTGGGLVLDGAAVLVADASKDSIFAGSAQTVRSYGAWANTAANGNVTVTGTLNVNAGVA